MPRIVMAVGGTGGHLLPAERFAKELEGFDVTYVGVGLSNNPYLKEKSLAISVDGAAPRDLRACGKLIKGLLQSLSTLKKIKPSLVIGFGSYHSFPVLLAAYLLRIPYLLYEPNTIYGKVNRLFAKKARCIATHFGHFGPKTRYLKLEKKSSAIANPYDLDPNTTTLLIFGGSQGSLAINRAFLPIANRLQAQIIHLIGKNTNLAETCALYAGNKFKVCIKIFEENMHLAYNSCQLVICRSGAGTIAELIAYQLPAILIPYPHASDDHQKYNAQMLENIGGAIVIEEKDLTSERLLEAIETALSRKEKMKEALCAYAREMKNQSFRELVGEII